MNKYLSKIRLKGVADDAFLTTKSRSKKADWWGVFDKIKWDYFDQTDSTYTNHHKLFLLLNLLSEELHCPVDLVVKKKQTYEYPYSTVLSSALERDLIALIDSKPGQFLDSIRGGQVLWDREQQINMDILGEFLDSMVLLGHGNSLHLTVNKLYTSHSLCSQLFPDRSVKFFSLQTEPPMYLQFMLMQKLDLELKSPAKGEFQWCLMTLIDQVRQDFKTNIGPQVSSIVNQFYGDGSLSKSEDDLSMGVVTPISYKGASIVRALCYLMEDNPVLNGVSALLPQRAQSLTSYVNPMKGLRYLFPAQFPQVSDIKILLNPYCSTVLEKNGVFVQIFNDLEKIIDRDRLLCEVIEQILSRICRDSISDEPNKIHALVQKSSFLAICYEGKTGHPAGIVSIMKWIDPRTGREFVYPAATVFTDEIKDSGLTEYLNNYYFQECLMSQAQARLRNLELPSGLDVVTRTCNPRILGTIWSYSSAVPNASHVPLFLSLRMLHSLKALGESCSTDKKKENLHVLGRIISYAPFVNEVSDKRLFAWEDFRKSFLGCWNTYLSQPHGKMLNEYRLKFERLRVKHQFSSDLVQLVTDFLQTPNQTTFDHVVVAIRHQQYSDMGICEATFLEGETVNTEGEGVEKKVCKEGARTVPSEEKKGVRIHDIQGASSVQLEENGAGDMGLTKGHIGAHVSGRLSAYVDTLIEGQSILSPKRLNILNMINHLNGFIKGDEGAIKAFKEALVVHLFSLKELPPIEIVTVLKDVVGEAFWDACSSQEAYLIRGALSIRESLHCISGFDSKETSCSLYNDCFRAYLEDLGLPQPEIPIDRANSVADIERCYTYYSGYRQQVIPPAVDRHFAYCHRRLCSMEGVSREMSELERTCFMMEDCYPKTERRLMNSHWNLATGQLAALLSPGDAYLINFDFTLSTPAYIAARSAIKRVFGRRIS